MRIESERVDSDRETGGGKKSSDGRCVLTVREERSSSSSRGYNLCRKRKENGKRSGYPHRQSGPPVFDINSKHRQ